MKEQLLTALENTIEALKSDGFLPDDCAPKISVEPTKDPSHGDLATNLALVLAKPAKKAPRQVAQAIVEQLQALDWIDSIDIAGPGFINFFLKAQAQFSAVEQILSAKEQYGRSQIGQGKKVQVEFVSANPTGPLHVGHGRGAAYGASVSDLLAAVGYQVEREYYVNDAGRQMDILAASSWLRYLALFDQEFPFPANAYQGDYVINDIAEPLKAENSDALVISSEQWRDGLPKDEPEGGDKEQFIDAVIESAKKHLGEARYRIVFDKALNVVLDDIRDDLSEFNVRFEQWFSERSLTEKNEVEAALQRLDEKGFLYEKNGAIWFKSTDFGDDKDRVVKRDNGQTTYFASDIAYHANKFDRGYDRVINVWGADHHGYIARVKAALSALGYAPEKLDILLVQFAILYRGSERVQMSTRSGSFVTLRELREDISNDAARFFYVMRKSDQHMDFDLELATSQTKDNPLYYIQYAHARICSLLEKAQAENLPSDSVDLELLTLDSEKALAKALGQFPDAVQQAAEHYAPHQLTHYLFDLAKDFHSYYNAQKMMTDDAALSSARLTLSQAVAQVIKNGLGLLGVDAPTSM